MGNRRVDTQFEWYEVSEDESDVCEASDRFNKMPWPAYNECDEVEASWVALDTRTGCTWHMCEHHARHNGCPTGSPPIDDPRLFEVLVFEEPCSKCGSGIAVVAVPTSDGGFDELCGRCLGHPGLSVEAFIQARGGNE